MTTAPRRIKAAEIALIIVATALPAIAAVVRFWP